MDIQKLEKELRAEVENAPRPFRLPDAAGSAAYMLEEFAELVSAINRAARQGDLRGRSDGEKDSIARELAQAAFMTSTTASLLGVTLPEMYPRHTNIRPIVSALDCVSIASRVAMHYTLGNTSVPMWVTGALHAIAGEVMGLASSLAVDLEQEIRAWMNERKEKAYA